MICFWQIRFICYITIHINLVTLNYATIKGKNEQKTTTLKTILFSELNEPKQKTISSYL